MEALEDDICDLFADNHNNTLSQKDSSPQPGDNLHNKDSQGSCVKALMTPAQEKDLFLEKTPLLSDIDSNNNILQNALSDFLQKTKRHGRWCRFKKSVRRGLQHIRRYI